MNKKIILLSLLALGTACFFILLPSFLKTQLRNTSIATSATQYEIPSEPESSIAKDPYSQLSFFQEGNVIGIGANNETERNVLMADVIRLEDGTYRMFYNAGRKGEMRINYAESQDGIHNWITQGTAIAGSTNPEDADYVIGGSRVLRLNDGSYRMYYRSTPEHEKGTAPSYSVYIASSTDGKVFTKEQVVIPNTREDANSVFSLVGHGAFFQLEDDTFAGFFSGNARDTERKPSDLYFTTSHDGITWDVPTKLYAEVHDPSVIKTADGYVLAAMHLQDYVGSAFSTDGLHWPEQLEHVKIYDTSGTLRTSTIGDETVGDVCLVQTDDGTLHLFTNFIDPETQIHNITVYSQK